MPKKYLPHLTKYFHLNDMVSKFMKGVKYVFQISYSSLRSNCLKTKFINYIEFGHIKKKSINIQICLPSFFFSLKST